jgi:hypothetical protein
LERGRLARFVFFAGKMPVLHSFPAAPRICVPGRQGLRRQKNAIG